MKMIKPNRSKKAFRATRGKNANKYYMFKNKSRRRSLKTLNGFITFFLVITGIALMITLLILILTPIFHFFLIIITLGLILLSDNYNMAPPEGTLEVLILSLIVFAALIVLQFIIEWIYILAESHSLNKKPVPEENGKYIKVSQAIKKVKIISVLSIIIMLAALAGIIYLNSNSALDEQVKYIGEISCAVIIIVMLIAKKVHSVKTLYKVQEQIIEIKEEWATEN